MANGTRQILTKSRLWAWRRCKRLHYLRYLQGWRPAKESDALKFGTLFHAGVEHWWRHGDIDTACEAIADEANESTDPALVVKAQEILRAYPGTWPDRADYEVLAVEKPARWPLINPDTMRTSFTFDMGGVVDLVLRRLSTDEIILVEHKSTSEDISDDAANYWKRLAMDSQLSIYVVACESLGLQVDRIIYDVVVRPLMNPLQATPEEKRKYKKDGSLYANQRDQDETLDDFRARLRADIEERPERYRRRREIARLESEIRDGMLDTWQDAKDMRSAELSGRHPRNPDACHLMGTCEMWDICALGVDPEHSTLYTRMEDMHPELTRAGAADAGNPPPCGPAEPALAHSRTEGR